MMFFAASYDFGLLQIYYIELRKMLVAFESWMTSSAFEIDF